MRHRVSIDVSIVYQIFGQVINQINEPVVQGYSRDA